MIDCPQSRRFWYVRHRLCEDHELALNHDIACNLGALLRHYDNGSANLLSHEALTIMS
jgi:hypothetical protein